MEVGIGEILSLLNKGYIYVEFTKKNGELRKMWCTRDNSIIKKCGHDIIQFNHWEIKNREKRNPYLLFVYDIQENDTRILNVKTIKKESIKFFSKLGEVDIPSIKTRFEKKAEDAHKSLDKELESEPLLETGLDLDVSKVSGSVDDLFL